MASAKKSNPSAAIVAEQTTTQEGLSKEPSTQSSNSKRKNIRKNQRPNYNQIHSKPLPLLVHPLPAFIPHNPLSFFRLAYVFLYHAFFPPSSHVKPPYRGYLSPETRSVHITDPATIRALWEQGFFGKGTLSRSEPTWLEAEKTRRGLAAISTAEENTAKRRQERRKFKEERARLQQEAIDELLKQESTPKSPPQPYEDIQTPAKSHDDVEPNDPQDLGSKNPEKSSSDGGGLEFPEYSRAQFSPSPQPSEPQDIPQPPQPTDTGLPTPSPTSPTPQPTSISEPEDPEAPSAELASSAKTAGITIPDQEHLQLTLEEAFFLRYALGVLDLSLPSGPAPTNSNILTLFRQNSYFPPVSPTALLPDDPFLLNYAVYHHFRSLGWVVRPGLKFSVDYLLYNRGPVFAHAAYAVLIIPAYIDPYWKETEERREEVGRKMRHMNWHWLHCVNRVQSQVLKTLVLAYVEVPSRHFVVECEGTGDIGGLLKGYRVREVVIKRWVPNRNLK